METEKNSVSKAIAENICNAVGGKLSLPLCAFASESSSSEVVNAAHVEEIEKYENSPVAPCNRATALKLLKRFSRRDFNTFWTSPVAEYLPAVSEGAMKLYEKKYPHDDALKYAKELIEPLSGKDLAKHFLFGVAHNAPEYISALACYYYIKNLPDHAFEKKYVGSVIGPDGEWEDRYNENGCEICGYQHAPFNEPKMRFWDVNMDMASFYFNARIGRSNLNRAILFLEEYRTLPRPVCSREDLSHFLRILDVIEGTPDNMTSGKLRRELKSSGLLSMTLDQIEAFIDMLGFLDILHPEDSHGMVYKHTCEKDMLPPLSDRGYAAHPVNRWTGKCGVDRSTVSLLFDSIYD